MMLGEARKRRAHYLSLLVKEGSFHPAIVAFQFVLAKLVHQSEFFTVGWEWGVGRGNVQVLVRTLRGKTKGPYLGMI